MPASMTSELALVPEASPNPAGRLRHEASELGVCLGDAQIARLRKKIEPDPRQPTLIKSVRGVGYVFTGKATP